MKSTSIFRAAWLAGCLALAACGVDGPPISPTPDAGAAPEPGAGFSGDAYIGIRADDI